jgi:hypothetical protein
MITVACDHSQPKTRAWFLLNLSRPTPNTFLFQIRAVLCGQLKGHYACLFSPGPHSVSDRSFWQGLVDWNTWYRRVHVVTTELTCCGRKLRRFLSGPLSSLSFSCVWSCPTEPSSRRFPSPTCLPLSRPLHRPVAAVPGSCPLGRRRFRPPRAHSVLPDSS